MNYREKLFDTLQFVGVFLGTLLSIILIFPAHQDPIASTILGLGITIIFQLFDLQKRQSASEERILQANALSQELYQNEILFKHIQDIVKDYCSVDFIGFELFKRRADNAVVECRNILHSLAEGNMIVHLNSPFSFGIKGLETATNLVKAIDAGDAAQWRDTVGEKYVNANMDAVKKGVKIIRVFIQPTNTLRNMVDILKKQQDAGIEVYIAAPESLPREFNQDFLIIDGRVCIHFELAGDKQAREERISINEVEIDRMDKKFEQILIYSRKLDEVIGDLK